MEFQIEVKGGGFDVARPHYLRSVEFDHSMEEFKRNGASPTSSTFKVPMDTCNLGIIDVFGSDSFIDVRSQPLPTKHMIINQPYPDVITSIYPATGI